MEGEAKSFAEDRASRRRSDIDLDKLASRAWWCGARGAEGIDGTSIEREKMTLPETNWSPGPGLRVTVCCTAQQEEVAGQGKAEEVSALGDRAEQSYEMGL